MGGILSFLQLILDCWNTSNWDAISGNVAKLSLGVISIVFDVSYVILPFIQSSIIFVF